MVVVVVVVVIVVCGGHRLADAHSRVVTAPGSPRHRRHRPHHPRQWRWATNTTTAARLLLLPLPHATPTRRRPLLSILPQVNVDRVCARCVRVGCMGEHSPLVGTNTATSPPSPRSFPHSETETHSLQFLTAPTPRCCPTGRCPALSALLRERPVVLSAPSCEATTTG